MGLEGLWERDRLITTTTPLRTPFSPQALIRCPNIFPRGHSHLYLTDHLHRDFPHHSLEVFGRKSWEFGCVICWYLEIYWHLPQQVGSGSNEGKEPESDIVKEEVFRVYSSRVLSISLCFLFFPRALTRHLPSLPVRDWWANMSVWRLMKEGGQELMVATTKSPACCDFSFQGWSDPGVMDGTQSPSFWGPVQQFSSAIVVFFFCGGVWSTLTVQIELALGKRWACIFDKKIFEEYLNWHFKELQAMSRLIPIACLQYR